VALAISVQSVHQIHQIHQVPQIHKPLVAVPADAVLFFEDSCVAHELRCHHRRRTWHRSPLTERTTSSMSCRIDRILTGEDGVVLRISGRIAADDVAMLRNLLEQETGAVALDLTHLLLVDRDAVKLLAAAEKNGFELRNCPAYVREWITRERTQSRE
jgi:hypothetical protein